ncbi:nuclear transport factor 2 family protein [Dyadobacter pollutisoli]|uniref:Nuclear transport factor 2 family protein n=1 Tax=Dyadobacter pollutisoli TaxID=2910158 RepID=A0A9E8NDP2_9BACT|nr:nuclear transport factor 2 family protein [Dyadobacter pollutisoli]WAC13101.1 nuclear transport factor 2 family protein [Dyadobacter pollutisoli]
MKSFQKVAMVFFLLSMIAVRAVSQTNSSQADAQTVSKLNKFRTDYCKSILDGKIDRLQNYFVDTIRLMPPFQKTVLGKVNASSYFRAFTNRFNVHSYIRHEIEMLDLGQQILETGLINMRMTVRSTGKEFDIVAKYLNLWVKTQTGEMRLLTEAWNADRYDGELHDLVRFDEVPGIHAAFLPNVTVTNNISFELAALNRLLDETVTNHDANTWSRYYSDDAMLLASYASICRGRSAIDEYINAHVLEMPVFEELDIRNDRIDNLGIFVVEYASHIASWRNGKRSGVGLGKNIRIWRREPDHTLKLFRSISMYD